MNHAMSSVLQKHAIVLFHELKDFILLSFCVIATQCNNVFCVSLAFPELFSWPFLLLLVSPPKYFDSLIVKVSRGLIATHLHTFWG